MAKTKEQKKQVVEKLTEKFSKMKSLVFLRYEGLKVSDIEEFRKKCKEAGVEYTVVKKTLMDLAMKNANLDIDAKEIEGNFGIVIGLDDEITPAKTVYDYMKTHEEAEIAGGVLWGRLADKAEVVQLAQLPSKDELLAKIVGSINAPVYGFVNVLAGNLRGLVQALNSIKENKQ
ncbi:MAG: 50S ribosomal protein L10 [Patescibacteria group bacterium]|nr:50S ribosomal protein L10 [Patescibacteria group bacterium]